MNWGKGIFIAFTAFIIFILYMVFTLMSKKTDLESEDYYKKEIAFQDEIDASKNYNLLDQKVEVIQDEQLVLIQLPDSLEIENINIHFTKPNDGKSDISFENVDTKNFMIEKSKLNKGKYAISISFDIAGKPHLFKDEITIE